MLVLAPAQVPVVDWGTRHQRSSAQTEPLSDTARDDR